MKITEIISAEKPSLSFEVFPPKTSDKFESVLNAASEIAKLNHVEETEHFLHVRSDDELVIKASGLESRAVIRLKEQK